MHSNTLSPTVQSGETLSVETAKTRKYSRLWTIGFWLIVAAGIFLRFYKIDQREYWCDESFTSITVSGHTRQEFNERLLTGKPVRVRDMRVFESTQGPRSGCLRDLLYKGGQHPPLYYGLARLWAERFGCSVAAMRSLPAILSVLVLPAAYWLCMELFQSTPVARIAVALLAISPNQVLYAQDAREYSAWLLLITIGCACLLKCLRQPSVKSWLVYSAVIVLGFYTFPLTAAVAAGQSIFVLCTQGLRRGKLFFSQLGALLLAGLLCIPWALAMIANHEAAARNLSYLEAKISTTGLVKSWNYIFDSIFVDFPLGGFKLATSLTLFGIAAIAGYILVRRAERKTCVFLMCLVASSTLPFVVPDLLFRTSHSTIFRYMMPAVLGAIIVIAFATNGLIQSTSRAIRIAGGVLLAGLVTVGTASCLYNSTIGRHYQCSIGVDINAIATAVNAADVPLFIDNAEHFSGQVETLCRLLNDDVILFASAGPEILPIPDQYSRVCLYSPAPEARIVTSPYFDFNRTSVHFGTLTRRAF